MSFFLTPSQRASKLRGSMHLTIEIAKRVLDIRPNVSDIEQFNSMLGLDTIRIRQLHLKKEVKILRACGELSPWLWIANDVANGIRASPEMPPHHVRFTFNWLIAKACAWKQLPLRHLLACGYPEQEQYRYSHFIAQRMGYYTNKSFKRQTSPSCDADTPPTTPAHAQASDQGPPSPSTSSVPSTSSPST